MENFKSNMYLPQSSLTAQSEGTPAKTLTAKSGEERAADEASEWEIGV